jgi:exosortase
MSGQFLSGHAIVFWGSVATHRHGVRAERTRNRVQFREMLELTRGNRVMRELFDRVRVMSAVTRFRTLAALPVIFLALIWTSLPQLREMFERWSHDPRYSHGFLVPAFAAYLLWVRRGMLNPAPSGGCWWGILVIAMGESLRLTGARFYVGWFESLALLPSLAGICLLFGGVSALRWAAPSLGFLAFMIPLPYRIEMALGYPLQRAATVASNYLLQTMGLPAVAEGNIIMIDDAKIGVVEACNGLGMLYMFLAIACGLALISKRVLLEKIFIVFSALPIAFAANVARISLTGLLHATVGHRVADVVYHDLAGWLMMPLAMAALWVELIVLSRLFIEYDALESAPIRLNPLLVSSAPRDGSHRSERRPDSRAVRRGGKKS